MSEIPPQFAAMSQGTGFGVLGHLSTAEENRFIDQYNDCRNDAERRGLVERWKKNAKPDVTEVRRSKAEQLRAQLEGRRIDSSDPNAARRAQLDAKQRQEA